MNNTGQYFYLKGNNLVKNASGSLDDYDDLFFLLNKDGTGNYAYYFKNAVFPNLSINDFQHDFSDGEVLFLSGKSKFEGLTTTVNWVDPSYDPTGFPTGAAAIDNVLLPNDPDYGIRTLNNNNHIWFSGDVISILFADNSEPIDVHESGVSITESSLNKGFIVLDGSGDHFVEIRSFAEGATEPKHYGLYFGASQTGLGDEKIAHLFVNPSNVFLGTDIYTEDDISGLAVLGAHNPSIPEYSGYQSSFMYNGGKSKTAELLVSFNKGNTIDISSSGLNSSAKSSFVFGDKSFAFGRGGTAIGYSCVAYDYARAENAGILHHPQSSIDGFYLDIRKEIDLLNFLSDDKDDYLFVSGSGLSKISDYCNYCNLALGSGAFVINKSNYARGNASHAEGSLNELHSSDLDYRPSHAEGYNNTLGAILSHIEGDSNSGFSDHASSPTFGSDNILNSHVEGYKNLSIGPASVGGKENAVLNEVTRIGNLSTYPVRSGVYGSGDFPSRVLGKGNVSIGAGNHVIGYQNSVDYSIGNSVRGSQNYIDQSYGENALNAAYGNEIRRATFSEGERNTSTYAYNFFKGSFCKSFFTNGFFAGEGHLGEIGDCQYFEAKLSNYVDLKDWVSGDFSGQELELLIKTCDDEDDVTSGEYLFIPNYSNLNFDVEFTISSSNGLLASGIVPRPIHSTFRSSGRIVRDYREDRTVKDSFGYADTVISGDKHIVIEGSDADMFYIPCHSSHASGTTSGTEFAGKREIEFFTGSGDFNSANQFTSYSDFVEPKMMFDSTNGKLTVTIDPINLSQFESLSLTGQKDIIFAEAVIKGNIITKELDPSDERITVECFNNNGVVESGNVPDPPVEPPQPPPPTIVPPPTLIPPPTVIIPPYVPDCLVDLYGVDYAPILKGFTQTVGVAPQNDVDCYYAGQAGGADVTTNPGSPWTIYTIADFDVARDGEISFGVDNANTIDLQIDITSDNPAATDWYGSLIVYVDDIMAWVIGYYGADGANQTFNPTALAVSDCSRITVYADTVNSYPEQNITISVEVTNIN